MIRLKHYFPFFYFLLVLLVTIFVYLPGLKGGFIFDDFPNLSEISKYGDMHDWENAYKFVSNGNAGPTGRPISLLTYVPQADAWSAGDAFSFKVVNLVIHLCCGLLLYWVTGLILRAYGEVKEEKIAWIALLSAGFWILHPFMVSTTLYVIQRMAQLPLLFSLLAIGGYLKGRALLHYKSYLGYALMTLSLGVGTVLATLSKENGALLPLLILVIEFCNPNKNQQPIWQWRTVCLWLPSFAILYVLWHYTDFSNDPWLNRNFNQKERVLTEGRIVVDYLLQLFVPRIEGYGLFQDGYVVSKSLFSPISTLFSIFFLFILFISGLLLRKKYPIFALSILFFFAAHLMESTVLGLELYFEHRNYLAAIFIFLPLATGLYALSAHIKPTIVVLVSVLVLLFLAIFTWQRALLWSDSHKLMLYWAQNSPNSPRAQSVIATVLAQSGNFEEANRVVEDALQKRPESGLLTLQLLLQKIEEGVVTKQDFIRTTQQIPSQRADIQAGIAVRDLILYTLNKPKIILLYGDDLILMLSEMSKNPSYLRIKDFKGYAFSLQGQIQLQQKKPDLAYQSFSQALALLADADEGLQMVINMGNAGYLSQALKLLDEVEKLYREQPNEKLKRSKQYYEKIILQTRHDMQNDLQAEQIN